MAALQIDSYIFNIRYRLALNNAQSSTLPLEPEATKVSLFFTTILRIITSVFRH